MRLSISDQRCRTKPFTENAGGCPEAYAEDSCLCNQIGGESFDIRRQSSNAMGHLRLGIQIVAYPFHDWTAVVTHCARLCFDRRKVNLSQVFARQQVGGRQSRTASE